MQLHLYRHQQKTHNEEKRKTPVLFKNLKKMKQYSRLLGSTSNSLISNLLLLSTATLHVAIQLRCMSLYSYAARSYTATLHVAIQRQQNFQKIPKVAKQNDKMQTIMCCFLESKVMMIAL